MGRFNFLKNLIPGPPCKFVKIFKRLNGRFTFFTPAPHLNFEKSLKNYMGRLNFLKIVKICKNIYPGLRPQAPALG